MACNEDTLRLEEELNIEARWTPDSRQYQEALVLMNERKYRQALDSLELLIVQRLFELSKLGQNGLGLVRLPEDNNLLTNLTGYKMREKISRALKARCKAIKNALDNYNLYAAKLNPPRPSLSWTTVVEAVYLAELDILRDTRQDIRTLKWAQPAHREAMNLHFGLKQAKVELRRLNVEIRRLVTFMRDDHIDYHYAIRHLMIADPPLAHELSVQWEYRNAIHEEIFWRLQQTAHLEGFSGKLSPGRHLGRSQDELDELYTFTLPLWLQTLTAQRDDDNGWEDDEEPLHGDEDEDVAGIVQFMDGLDA